MWGKKQKRVWDEAETEAWRAEEAKKAEAKKILVDSLGASWKHQLPPFRTDFVDSYATSDPQAAQSAREALGIEIQSDTSAPGLTPAPMKNWSDLQILDGLPWITKSLQEHNWLAPMPVQAQAFPILLGGRNLIGIAQTGSGKTIAFMLPAVIHAHDQRPLSQWEQGPIVLVLAPTRELAVQISEEADKLVKYSRESTSQQSGLRSTCFYGGGKKWEQLAQFGYEGSHFVVATPGRLMDVIADEKVSLKRVTYFCLDEADRMLDLGFLGDMEQLSSVIRPDKQMAFFSATWPKEVQSLAYNLSTSGQPVTMRVSQAGRGDDAEEEQLQAREGICQQVVMIEEVEGRNKWGRQDYIKRELLDAHIKNVLASDPIAKILIFVNQKDFADELSTKLYDLGISADAIHGGRQQGARLSVLDQFRKGELRVLIATDVVGRGLDIPHVTNVVVYSMNSVQDYIHRIGRTGRGKDAKGHALVFFEYMEKQASIAGELVDVLKRSKQPVPPELQQIADEVKSGVRVDYYKQWEQGGGNGSWQSGENKWAKTSWNDGLSNGTGTQQTQAPSANGYGTSQAQPQVSGQALAFQQKMQAAKQMFSSFG